MFFEKFDQFTGAPDAVAGLRELVLDLAMQGRLVQRNPSEGDGHSLLRKLRTLPPEHNSKARAPKGIVVEPETVLAIPDHWALTTIENTTRDTGFFCDGDWVESKDQDPEGDVRLIQLADVGDGQYRDRSSRFMTKAAATRLNCTYLEPGDILVARMPEPLGRCCRFPGDSKPAVTVVDVCILRPNAAFFDPEFLVVAINCPRFRRLVLEKATGTTRSRISRSNLGALPIPLPPLTEQKRIVAKVSELMALCERLEAQQQEREVRHLSLARAALGRFAETPTPANLEFLFHKSYDTAPADVRKAILALAVQGRLVPQDRNDEPAENALRRCGVDLKRWAVTEVEKRHPVPESWTWIRFAGVGEQRLGKMLDVQKNRGTLKLYLRNTNVQWMRFDLNDVKEMRVELQEEEELRLRYGDLLICEGGEPGRCAIWRDEVPEMYFQKALHRVRPCEHILSEYLALNLQLDCRNGVLAGYFTGATIKHLTGRSLSEYPVPVPPMAEQRRIAAKVDDLLALVNSLEEQSSGARTAGAALLAAAVAELTREG